MIAGRARRAAGWALAALALALTGPALAGCGGALHLSSRQLRAAAAKTCASASARTARIATPLLPSGGETFLRRGLNVLTPELAQLRRLRAPGDVAHAYSVALDAFSRKLSLMRTAIRWLERGADPVTAVRTLQDRLAPIESREDAAWRALDLPECLDR